MYNNNRQYHSQVQQPLYYRSSIQSLSNQVRVSFLKKSSSQQRLRTFALPQFIRQNSMLYDKCILCQQFHNKSQMESISKCNHIFCTTCLHRYCIYKIDVMQDVNCPQEGCLQLLQPTSKVFEQLPQNTKDKYKRNILWKQTISNPNLKLCPKQNCQGVIDKTQSVYQCSKCRTKYCKECELILHNGPCDTNFQDNFKDWKRCPQCKMFIQRTQGCNHMTCRCGHQFCFICLAAWNDTHYQCGTENINTQIAVLPCWKRILYVFLIIIFFPISLAVFIAFWALSIVLGAIVGFFSGPVLFYTRNSWAQNPCCGLFCPLTLPFGIIGGIFMTFCYGIYLLCSGIGAIMLTLRALCCNCQQPGQDADEHNDNMLQIVGQP